MPPGTFDVIILNGLLNYGVDTVEDAEEMIEACATAMRRGGLLLIGWNRSPGGVTTDQLPSLGASFQPAVLEPLPGPTYVTVGTISHNFEVHRRR